MDVFQILIIIHLVGTALGVGGATFAEINVLKALKDGIISPDESNLMHGVYTTMRVGLVIAVLSGLGFLVYYQLNGMEELLYQAKLWAKMTIIGFLVLNAVLLHKKKISLLWGSAISFTAWYAALIIGSLGKISYSYFEILGFYAVFVVVAAGAIHLLHKKLIPRKNG